MSERPTFNKDFYDRHIEMGYKYQENGYEYEYSPTVKNQFWNLPDQPINGIVIHSVGCPQPKARVFVRNFNGKAIAASVHGFIEPGKYIETAPTRNSVGNARKCYHVGGRWNSSRIGLEMCEPSTIRYVGGISWKDRDPEATRKYLLDVTATAVLVVADLCIYHDIPVDMISTHRQAYLTGNGSNHGDPEHVWSAIGYTLDMFRQDVQAAINERKGDILADMTREEFDKILKDREPKIFATLDDIPEWGKAAVQKCMANGFLNGSGKDEKGRIKLDLTQDLLRLLVINDRAGLYDKKPTIISK